MPEPAQPERTIRNTHVGTPSLAGQVSPAGKRARAASLPRLAMPLDPAVANFIDALARAAARADHRRR